MAKMKSVRAAANDQATTKLTSRMQFQALVTSISFFSATFSNFLNGFFMRPPLQMPAIFVSLKIF